ncbi:PAK-box/P21-Rho-binding [Penicillium odoratum]|uniref:PAK-box/P21-Rho-binding n=1 Tax=Penicillium odoratum TaxID=1167516 RepID=UPI00254865B6|nr:PAK-box/P21-Rho-binding [Penicillium odoratum]KAJ5765600.1 PAK-box/P21-Rho-binding [Penicillium odoratum]
MLIVLREGSSLTSSMDGSFSSQDERTTSSLGMRADRPDRSSRSLLARGSRILRRQGSKVNIVATLDEEDENDRDKPREKDMFGRRSRHVEQQDRLKSLISDPFDFHHLTHTSPAQFQSLDQTRENDLCTEFSVIRASQRPETGLKGIRATDIHFRNFSTDDLAAYGTATTVDEPSCSPPASPPGSISPGHIRRESRVGENFSRPVPRFPRACPTTPPSVTPEIPDAEPAPRAIDEILGLTTATTYPENIHTAPSIRRDSADDLSARTSSISSHYDLADVPEEEEATRMWDSPEASIGYAHSRSTSQQSQPTEAYHSSTVKASKAPLSIFVAEQLSRQFSEALGSPTLPQNLPDSLPKTLPKSEITPPTSGVNQFSYEDELYDSWDADIDYCYEHAAESTCNFDWSRTSLEDTQRPKIGVPSPNEAWLVAPKVRQLQPSPLSTSAFPTPDLDSSPARSTPLHLAHTPSTAEYEGDFIVRNTGDYFQPVSSLSGLKQIPPDTLYEDYLSTDAESDRHFSFSQGIDNPVSPRSSFSPISKCNSQESLMLSRAASIARKHRSSVSTTSVPELIHSLSSSRELMPTDRLTAGETLAAGSSISRPPSTHRQTKSPAESYLLLQGNVGDLPSTIVHDKEDIRPVKESLPAVPSKHPSRKKSRNPSYSLFPTGAH